MRSIFRVGAVFIAGLVVAAAFGVAPRRFLAPAGADGLPAITIGSVSVWEGNAGSAVVYVPVDMSVPSLTKVKVHYSVVGTSATAGDDFSANSSGWVTFAIGKATNHIRVVVYGDTTVEPDENISITLDSPVGATLEQPNGGVTILDDDSEGAGPGIQVNVGSVDVVEADAGHHTVSVPITLSQPAPTTIKVKYVADCATALPGTDYSGKYSGTLTFNTGQQSKLLTFTVVADFTPEDLVKQFLESVTVALGPAVVGNEVDGGGEIIDNDGTSGGTNNEGLAVGQIERASVASDGSQGNSTDTFCATGPYQWGSMNPTMSGNGRYVAFTSDANNLVPSDNNSQIDSFVHDLVTGETQRISVQNDGSEFTADYQTINPWQVAKSEPSISYDGHYATFTDVYTGRIYLRDLVAQTTELISVAPDGSGPNDFGAMEDTSSVSADGRYVVFTSKATNMVVPDAPVGEHVYLRDRQTQTTRLVATYQNYQGGPTIYGGAKISGDGRFVVFQDNDGSLVPGDTNGCIDTFVYDVANATFERDSVDSAGQPQTGCVGEGDAPVISYDGRYVGFSSPSRSLYGAGPTDTVAAHGYIHDRVTGTTTLVDDPAIDPINGFVSLYGISDDGRYATWTCQSCGEPLPADPTQNDSAAYWTDLQTGVSTQIGLINGDQPTNDDTGERTSTTAMGMSGDGTVVAFHTWATNLIPDDTNQKLDVYVERML